MSIFPRKHNTGDTPMVYKPSDHVKEIAYLKRENAELRRTLARLKVEIEENVESFNEYFKLQVEEYQGYVAELAAHSATWGGAPGHTWVWGD